MAYTTVPTVATGDLWTAANHNTYIRDNFAAGVPDLFTTKGDSAWATAADTAARLAVGSNKQAVFADSVATPGVAWKYGDPYADFLVAKSAAQTGLSTGETIITFDTERLDPDGVFGSNKFTAPVAGLYFLCAKIRWYYTATYTTFDHHWYFKKNGSSSGSPGGFRNYLQSAAADQNVQLALWSTIVSLSASDYVETAINIVAGNTNFGIAGGTDSNQAGADQSIFYGFLIR